ncbi:period circadian protein homolog 3 isoform X2 [Lacerta agilis]|uniref:period circadian protein homolog 3 isoform X2 n=1 Tax=Lacerta agilis TaxID=80427 RepID=UPI001419687E|nr:period circadian protein homolog 3 isoform X2 [Lacerta agilis]
MNEDLLQDDFLEQQENWLPANLAEIENQEGDTLEEQNGTCEEAAAQICCGGSTESSSIGNESIRTSTHGLESNGSLARNPDGQDRSVGGSGSSSSCSSELLCWNQSSNRKLKLLIQEMKQYLPAEQVESCSKASTLCALNYALKCVQQIQADNKVSKAFGEHGAHQTNAPVYGVEELAAIMSEHSPKNTDTFVAVFSLHSGRTVHVSEQAASVLNCKRKCLKSCRFAELLAPQDVGVFYTHTNQAHLPLWNTEAPKDSLYEYAQVKSFFCRLRGGKGQDQEKHYYPFRMTPYLINFSVSDPSGPMSCCLALAEKIHSGYEAPRIPVEKRIFTTTHTPGCLFLEVDDRAVPLLGYLPQDLHGTSILQYLHPDDRPIMVAIHRKVLKFAGRPPFEHSPIRFCTQNGDYVILDTSWSSFVNPWSRKVIFIIGRHKVRTSPLNEDVFAARSKGMNRVDKEIWELQGQIYKLHLQPVCSNSSSGYGSLISNGSYEHYISVASSSDSNGNCAEEIQRELMSLQQIFVDANRLKNVGQRLYIESHRKPQEGTPRAEQPGDKKPGAPPSTLIDPPAESCDALRSTNHILSYQQINCMDSIIRYLESCNSPALKRKCESSTNASSSSSDDDRQAQLSQNDKQILEDAAKLPLVDSQPPVMPKLEGDVEQQAPARVVGGTAAMTDLALTAKALSVVSTTSQCSYSSTLVHFPHPESEATALEEATLQGEQVEPSLANPTPSAAGAGATLEEVRLVGLTKEVLSAHTQKKEQEYVDRFRQRALLSSYRPAYLQHGGARSSQPRSQDQDDVSPKQTRPVGWKRKTKPGKFKRQKPLGSPDSRSGAWKADTSQGPNPGAPSFALPADPYAATPGFPVASLGGGPVLPPSATAAAPATPPYLPCSIQPLPAFREAYMGGFMTVLFQNFPAYPPQPPPPPPLFPPPPSFSAQLFPCPSAASYLCPVMPPGPPSALPMAAPGPMEHPSPPSTPVSAAEEEQPASSADPPHQRLFSNSRSSSPLQLDLLQEELPKPLELPSAAQAPLAGTGAMCEQCSVNNDSHSISSELFDLLLLEDSQSGSSSAASGSGSAESSSLVSGSNGSSSNETSGCGTGSRNSSKYFARSDSSEVSKRGKNSQEGGEEAERPLRPARIAEEVLKEDLEKLATMESKQPCFSEGQKEELAEVHPWIRTQTVPQEIDTQGCIMCDNRNAGLNVIAGLEDRDPQEEDSKDLLDETLLLPPQAPP